MIGDVSDFVKLVAVIKKKVHFIFFTTSEVSIIGSSWPLEGRCVFLHLSLSLGRRKRATATAVIWMTMHKFVAVTYAVPFLSSFSEYRFHEVIRTHQKATLSNASRGDCTTIGDLKKKINVGTGCGGCMPLARCSLAEFRYPN